MIPALSAGILLGLSAGLAPGPMLTLVVSQALRHGAGAGVRVAFAPLLTDLPIVVLSLAVLAQLAAFQRVLGVLSLAGGALVLYMAYENLRAAPPSLQVSDRPARSLARGVAVNFLNPHPYLFWLTVGAPTLIDAWSRSTIAAAAFVAGFYACLVGTKALVAVLAGRTRHALSGRVHVRIMRMLGVLLLGFAVLMFREALGLLGALAPGDDIAR
jgi:threonine/homoserine/homoserine lactone efflux protein